MYNSIFKCSQAEEEGANSLAAEEKKRVKHMWLEGVSVELVENSALPAEGHQQTLKLTRQVGTPFFYFMLVSKIHLNSGLV
jgi:hypothetical protein